MAAVRKELYNNELRALTPLSSLPLADFKEVVAKTVIQEIRAGQYLYQVGDADHQFIYLLQGELNLVVDKEVVSTLVGGSDAARYPVSTKQPRENAARARTRILVARIDTSLLDVLTSTEEPDNYQVQDIGSDGNDDWIARLLHTEVFRQLPFANTQQVLTRIQPRGVEAGEVIVRQGDEGDDFYIIKSGRCIVSRKPSPGAQSIKLAELVDGDSFGEEALLSNAKRNASVTMATNGCLMCLAKQDFVELLQESLVFNVDYEEALNLVEAGAFWLDVRMLDEYQRGALRNSIHLPLSEVRERAAELSPSVQYIVCCSNGLRSTNAAFLFSQLGLSVRVLEGGLKKVPGTQLQHSDDSHSGVSRITDDRIPQPTQTSPSESLVTQKQLADNEVAVQLAQAETAALHAKLRAIRSGHETAVGELQRRVADLEQTLYETLEQVKTQQQRVADNKQEAVTQQKLLEQKLEEAYVAVDAHERQFDDAHQALGLAQKESEGLDRKQRQLQQALNIQDEQHLAEQEKLQGELTTIQAHKDAEITRLGGEVEASRAEHEAAAKQSLSQLEALQASFEKAQSHVEELQCQLSDSQGAGELAQKESEGLDQEHRQLQQVLDTQQQQHMAEQEKLQGELCTIQAHKDVETSRFEEKAEASRAEHEAAAKQSLSQLEALQASFEKAQSHVEELQSQLNGSQGAEQQLQEQIVALEIRQNELQDQWQGSEQQLRTSQEQCTRLEQERELEQDQTHATAERQEKSLEDLHKQLSEVTSTAGQAALVLQAQLKDLQKSQEATEREYEQDRSRWASEAKEWANKDVNSQDCLEAATVAGTRQAEESRLALDKLLQEADELRCSLEETGQQRESAVQLNEQQQQALDDRQQQLTELERRLNTATEQRETAKQQYADLQLAMADSEEVGQQERVEWQQQLATANQERDEANISLTDSMGCTAGLEARLEGLQGKLSGVEKELSALQGGLSTEQENSTQLQGRIQGLVDELDETRAARDQQASQARELEETLTKQGEKDLAQLATERVQTAEEHEQALVVLHQDLDELRDQHGTVERQCTDLQDQYGQLQQEHEASKTLAARREIELRQLHDEIEASKEIWEKERDELARGLDKGQQQTQQDSVAQQQQESVWQSQREAFEHQLRQLEEGRDQLVSERDAVTSKLHQQAEELEGLQQRISVLEVEEEGDHQALRKELEAAEEQVRSGLEKLEEQAQEHCTLKAELDVSSGQATLLRKEVETIQRQEVQATTGLQEQLEQQQQENETLNEEVLRLEGLVDNADTSVIDQLQQDVAQQEILKKELVEAQETLSAQNAQLNEELGALRTDLIKVGEESMQREQALESELYTQRNKTERDMQDNLTELQDVQSQLEEVLASEKQESAESSAEEAAHGVVAETLEESAEGELVSTGPTSQIDRLKDQIKQLLTSTISSIRALRQQSADYITTVRNTGLLVIAVLIAVILYSQFGGDSKLPNHVSEKPSAETEHRLSADGPVEGVEVSPTKGLEEGKGSTVSVAQDQKGSLLEKARVRILNLRQFLDMKNASVSDFADAEKSNQQVEADAKPVSDSSSKSPVTQPARVTRVTRGREFRDQLSDGTSGPVMLELASGHFAMGSKNNSQNFDERPQHEVQIARFAMGKYEVTFAQYDRFVNAVGKVRPKDEGWGRGNLPVINVSWEEAIAYTQWLSDQTGHQYRLPSEAEWEYAARAGTRGLHWWGNGKANANCFDCGSSWGGVKVAPVGRFNPNRFGLHDTAGNAAEWVQDCHQKNYKGAPTDGSAWLDATCKNHVVRGGSYASPLSSIRSSKRTRRPGNLKLDTVGFRIVREL